MKQEPYLSPQGRDLSHHEDYDSDHDRRRSKEGRYKVKSKWDEDARWDDNNDMYEEAKKMVKQEDRRDVDTRDNSGSSARRKKNPSSHNTPAWEERSNGAVKKEKDTYIREDKGLTTYYHYPDDDLDSSKRTSRDKKRRLSGQGSPKPERSRGDGNRSSPSPIKAEPGKSGGKRKKRARPASPTSGSLLEKVTEILKSCNELKPMPSLPVKKEPMPVPPKVKMEPLPKVKQERTKPLVKPEEAKELVSGPEPLPKLKKEELTPPSKASGKPAPKMPVKATKEPPIKMESKDVDNESSLAAEKALEDGEINEEEDSVIDANIHDKKSATKRKVKVALI